MAIHEYPYTDFHEMNLDWIINEMKKLVEELAEFEHKYTGITAEAQTVPYGAGASVNVTGGTEGEPFNFEFDIPAGKDLKLVNSLYKYGTSTDTVTPPGTWYDNVPTIPQGYYLWTRVTLNFNDGTQSVFYSMARNGMDGTGSVVTVNNISPDILGNVTVPLPQPSDNTPLMDTTLGSEGVSADYSRADHQHVSDSTKLNVQNGTQPGDLNAYVVQDISTQTIVPVSAAAAADSIAMYTNSGSLVVGEPQTVNEAPRLLDVQNGFVSNTAIQNYVQFSNVATASDVGVVQVDGTSITVDADGVISSSAGELQYDTLWSNGSPGNSFSGHTIYIDTTGYHFIMIQYRINKSEQKYVESIITLRAVGNTKNLITTGMYTTTYSVVGREATLSRGTNDTDGYVTFGDAYYRNVTNGTGTNNENMVPQYVIGIK